jgi:hypothetical protein
MRCKRTEGERTHFAGIEFHLVMVDLELVDKICTVGAGSTLLESRDSGDRKTGDELNIGVFANDARRDERAGRVRVNQRRSGLKG